MSELKKDMEIVRGLLLKIPNVNESLEYDPLNEEDKLLIYHVEILKQAGLVEYENKFQDMIPKVYINEPRLTWDGNDYIDTITNDKVWEKTKNVIKSKGIELGQVPFSLIKAIALQQLKNWIG